MDPLQNPIPAQLPVEKKKGHGVAIAITLIVIVAVIAGFYLWGRNVDNNMTSESITEEETSAQAITSSDDASSIEADLNATQISGENFSDVNDIQ
ncbi:MAG TPA: hypothetical protein VIR98_03780 [Candidatus Paceibacterota bacterium]|jgi:hypothetical protein